MDYANSARVPFAAHLRGVLTGGNICDKRGLEIVAWLQTYALEFCLLARFPIVVFQDARAVLIAQLDRRIRKRVRNRKLRERRADRADHYSHRAILDDESGDHELIARLNETTRGNVGQARG